MFGRRKRTEREELAAKTRIAQIDADLKELHRKTGTRDTLARVEQLKANLIRTQAALNEIEERLLTTYSYGASPFFPDLEALKEHWEKTRIGVPPTKYSFDGHITDCPCAKCTVLRAETARPDGVIPPDTQVNVGLRQFRHDGASIVNERRKVRGNYYQQSQICQRIKATFRVPDGWNRLDYAQQEALDNIANKIARILIDQTSDPDNWIDINGYSHLICERLKKNGKV